MFIYKKVEKYNQNRLRRIRIARMLRLGLDNAGQKGIDTTYIHKITCKNRKTKDLREYYWVGLRYVYAKKIFYLILLYDANGFTKS